MKPIASFFFFLLPVSRTYRIEYETRRRPGTVTYVFGVKVGSRLVSFHFLFLSLSLSLFFFCLDPASTRVPRGFTNFDQKRERRTRFRENGGGGMHKCTKRERKKENKSNQEEYWTKRRGETRVRIPRGWMDKVRQR